MSAKQFRTPCHIIFVLFASGWATSVRALAFESRDSVLEVERHGALTAVEIDAHGGPGYGSQIVSGETQTAPVARKDKDAPAARKEEDVDKELEKDKPKTRKELLQEQKDGLPE